LNATGIPYDYEIEPGWEEHVRILREWNPEVGVYRVPEKFNLTINAPEDAAGAHLVTLTGQEHHSFREVSNETYFILTVGEALAEVDLSISDVLVPEFVKEYEPFNLTFKIDNLGALDVATTISLIMPEDWEVDEPSQTIRVKGGSSEAGRFTVIPTTTAGEISFLVEYPFKGEIVNFTTVGPYVAPGVLPTTTTTQPQPQPFYMPIANYIYSLASPLIQKFEEMAGVYAVPITVGVIIILLIIIFWILSEIFKFARTKGRGEPETMKKPKTKTTKQEDEAPGLWEKEPETVEKPEAVEVGEMGVQVREV